MVYAIVRAGGRQEKVEVGTVLTVDRQKAGEDGSVTFAPVLLVDGETIGTVDRDEDEGEVAFHVTITVLAEDL